MDNSEASTIDIQDGHDCVEDWRPPKDRKKLTTSKGHTFTINNYTQADIQAVIGLRCQWTLIIKHLKKEEQPRHLQCYVWNSRATTWLYIKRILPSAVIEHHRQRISKVIQQIHKLKDYQEYGERPCPGNRSDIQDIVQWRIDGMSPKEVLKTRLSSTYTRYTDTIEIRVHDQLNKQTP